MLTSDPLAGKPMVIGIGAQKAGSTWLYSQISRHERVYVSPLKEMHFFDALYLPEMFGRFDTLMRDRLKTAASNLDANSGDDQLDLMEGLLDRLRMRNGVAAYMAYFRKRVLQSHTVFGEITPAYASLDAAGFRAMRDCHPDVRVIFILRDPVDRLISAARNRSRHRGRPANADDIAVALDQPDVMARSRYDITLAHLDAVFTPQSVLLGFYETMFQGDFAERLANFLGLPDLVCNAGERVNAAPDVWAPDERLEATLRRRLAPVYDACQARFGDGLPSAWRA